MPPFNSSYTGEEMDDAIGKRHALHTNEVVKSAGTSDADFPSTSSMGELTFADTQARASLPAAGTYLVIATIAAVSNQSQDVAGVCKLYNATAGADVSEEFPIEIVGIGLKKVLTISQIVTVSEASEIQIHAGSDYDMSAIVELTQILQVRLQ